MNENCDRNPLNKIVILSLLSTLLIVLFSTGCTTIQNSGVAGNYVNVDHPSDYIELHSDGTLIDHPGGTTIIYYGTYEIVGTKIRLTSNDKTVTHEYQFVNDSIVIDQGYISYYTGGNKIITYKKQ